MAGLANEESEIGRSFEGFSSGQQLQLCQSGEALAEWRSSAQVENGSPSTSPPYWDSDEDDEGGSKPSDLYGKYTWKIDKFSQINKRELRSNAFEVGGYKWYILIYPQGCDVCNHLSLFLCVANHDKLLPGWSHFAQFTIAVVNKDHKKSKFSDTLHRFWKKEHDWGWKKFMELSKVLDGFIDDDTLTIKAQVQVIRERADQPFRCLDRQYRRELVRVYLTNVEQVCRRFVEERRGKLVKLIDDKARWSSFCAFWLGMDQSSKRNMSQEKKELILKFIVKHFFIEKEVTSTLVMDALYSGLKALEGQNKGKKKGKFLEAEELPIPIVCIEKDTFVLVDDVLLLLGRAAMEPLPPKDDKGPQNRMKDAAGEEFNKDYSEREERRLTELGRRTIEIFVLAHIFSKIEVAYQEAVALKKQEELIREEEAACVAELEQRTRRGTADKEKKSKKKQGRQKRSNRKGKDKGKDDKSGSFVQDKVNQYGAIVERNDLAVGPEMAFEIFNAIDDASDLSDSVDFVLEILPPESEDGAASPVSCVSDTVHPLTETNNSEISGLSVVQNVTEGKSTTVVDDCSSTCSSDSVPSLVTHKGNAHFHKSLKSPRSGWNQQHKWTSDRVDWVTEEPSGTSECLAGARHSNGASQSSSTVGPPSQSIRSSQDRAVNETKHQMGKKEEETDSFRGNSQSKDAVGSLVSGDGHARRTSPPRSPSKNIPSIAPLKSDPKSNALMDAVMPKKQPLDTPKVNSTVLTSNSTGNTDAPKFMAPKSSGQASNVARDKLQVREVVATAEKPSIPLIPALSRPSSAPLAPGLKPTVSVALMVQTAPALSRPASAVGRLGLEPSASATPGFVPQSYRNAMLGVSASGSLSTCPQNHSATSMINTSHSFLQEPAVVSAPLFSPLSTDRPVKPSLPFGMPNHHNILQHEPLWIEQPQRDSTLNVSGDRGPLINDTSLNLYNAVQSRSQDRLQSEFPACTSGRQSQGHVLPDEFPHLDIINELLDDEHGIGLTGRVNSSYQNFSNCPQSLNRHYSFPGDPGMSSGLGTSQSSCRFDRAHSYHGDLRPHCYGASGRVYDTLGDMIPQSGPQTYANGPIDGFMQRQWQMPASSDLPFLNVRHVDDAGGYSYRMPEYQNLNAGINGYNVFRQPNGL